MTNHSLLFKIKACPKLNYGQRAVFAVGSSLVDLHDGWTEQAVNVGWAACWPCSHQVSENIMIDDYSSIFLSIMGAHGGDMSSAASWGDRRTGAPLLFAKFWHYVTANSCSVKTSALRVLFLHVADGFLQLGRWKRVLLCGEWWWNSSSFLSIITGRMRAAGVAIFSDLFYPSNNRFLLTAMS